MSFSNLPPLSRPSALCGKLAEDYALSSPGKRGSSWTNGLEYEDEEVKDDEVKAGSPSRWMGQATEIPGEGDDYEEDEHAEVFI